MVRSLLLEESQKMIKELFGEGLHSDKASLLDQTLVRLL